ncbi:tRNA pseudouridine synthase B [Desulfonema limicola]|uniref:tRNA pseudouridine synthase B n=1 Tax=Desulfonema limicola TaxID=45656 RepID=A0A975GEZ6_9BACT|nr:tRNA pseudouridine(55) synthase TruB [Desulfonema limicola]QTA78645.1 tRNA pseudouridine synthase B [Desulfonema limicola]
MLNGILLVDKPENMSSAKLVSKIKHLARVKKAGHAGTLDPFATGLMICCLNKATKLSGFFLNSSKTYEGTLCLGIETDTQDSTGTIISRYDKTEFDLEAIKKVFAEFTGSIKQMPPVYSALKHQGIPLYKLARKGKPVQKPEREIFISNLDITAVNLPEIKFCVSCSSGTYIRTLAADIGKKLGSGAHLKQLRRTGSGRFIVKNAVSLEKIAEMADSGNIKNHIVSMSDALSYLPYFQADKFLTEKIMYGRTIFHKDIKPCVEDLSDNHLRVVDKNNRLLAVLSHKKNSDSYNYCCVFINNMDNIQNN